MSDHTLRAYVNSNFELRIQSLNYPSILSDGSYIWLPLEVWHEQALETRILFASATFHQEGKDSGPARWRWKVIRFFLGIESYKPVYTGDSHHSSNSVKIRILNADFQRWQIEKIIATIFWQISIVYLALCNIKLFFKMINTLHVKKCTFIIVTHQNISSQNKRNFCVSHQNFNQTSLQSSFIGPINHFMYCTFCILRTWHF